MKETSQERPWLPRFEIATGKYADQTSWNSFLEDFDNDNDKKWQSQKKRDNLQEDFDRLLIAIGLPAEREPELEEKEEEEIKIIGKIHEMLWADADKFYTKNICVNLQWKLSYAKKLV